jgi:hypothetical protein
MSPSFALTRATGPREGRKRARPGGAGRSRAILPCKMALVSILNRGAIT